MIVLFSIDIDDFTAMELLLLRTLISIRVYIKNEG